MGISPPLETAATRFLEASELAAMNLAELLKALRVLSKSKKIPLQYSDTIAGKLFLLEANWMSVNKYKDPFSSLALITSLLISVDTVKELSRSSPEIGILFAKNVKKITQPYVDFTNDHGPAIITAGASLASIFKNPSLSALALGMQACSTGVKFDSTIIDMPANLVVAVEMLREVTPTLLLLVILMSVATVYAAAQFEKPSKQTQQDYRFAEIGAEFIDAAKKSVAHSYELVDVLKMDITKAKHNAALISQAFKLKVAGMVAESNPDPNAVMMLLREIDPLLESKDLSTSKAAAKVVQPLIQFTQNYASELSAASVKVAAIAAHPELAAFVLGMSAFTAGSPAQMNVVNNTVSATLTAATMQTLNPKIFTLAACFSMFVLYRPKAQLEITDPKNSPNKSKD